MSTQEPNAIQPPKPFGKTLAEAFTREIALLADLIGALGMPFLIYQIFDFAKKDHLF
jgi:hypothetical protein